MHVSLTICSYTYIRHFILADSPTAFSRHSDQQRLEFRIFIAYNGYECMVTCWLYFTIHLLGGSPNTTVSTFLHLKSYLTTTTSPPLARSGSDKGIYILTLCFHMGLGSGCHWVFGMLCHSHILFYLSISVNRISGYSEKLLKPNTIGYAIPLSYRVRIEYNFEYLTTEVSVNENKGMGVAASND